MSSNYTFRYPMTMGYCPLNFFSVSLKSGRCSSIKGGRYVRTIRVRLGPVTILQLTTFVSWKHVDSISHPLDRYLVTRPTQPWDTQVLAGHAFKYVTSYSRQLWGYAPVWVFVSIISIMPNHPRSTTWMD